MTIGKKLHKTLSSLESVKADYEIFAQDTDDKMARKMFQSGAQQLDSLISDLRDRVNFTEQQEPQYQVEQQMRGQKQ